MLYAYWYVKKLRSIGLKTQKMSLTSHYHKIRCLPDSPKPDSPKLGFRVRLGFMVRVRG